MAISSWQFAFNGNNVATSLAQYKAAGAGMVTTLAAIGLVQTSDTGQANYATVASVPTSAGTDYTVWKLNDTLQATAPFFIKIFTYAPNSAGFLVVIQIATRTDGAGTPQGNVSGNFTMNNNSGSFIGAGTYTNTAYMSGDGSRFSSIYAPDNIQTGGVATTTGGWSIERLKDSTGADTGQGLAVTWDGRGSGKISQVIFAEIYGSIYPAAPAAWTSSIPNAGTASFGGNIGLFPIFPNIGYPNNPNTGVLGYFGLDIPTPSSILTAVSLYGVAHNFMTSKVDGNAVTGVNGNGNTVGGAWRYE